MTNLLLPKAALFAMVVTCTPSEASTNARHPDQQLEIVQPSGDTLVDWVTTEFHFADDGRLIASIQPDGGQRVHCYPDGAGREVAGGLDGCPEGSDQVDRLTLANVVKVIHESTQPGGQGTADYTKLSSGASYQEDNLLAGMSDGLDRGIDLPIPNINQTVSTNYSAEQVSGSYGYDGRGRLQRYQGGGEGGSVMRMEYGADADRRGGAGLVKKLTQGSEGNTRFWTEFDYDDAYNVEEERTSYGAFTKKTYDRWDRPVRTVSGLSDGRFRQVGTEECSEAAGAVSERAFDAAGHVVRERRLQDYVDASGTVRCRWVETQYKYNAREQLVSVSQTHLASPDDPGMVVAAAREVQRLEYDPHGRVDREILSNLRTPNMVTDYRYDAAGRMAGVKVGDAGEQRQGYDANSRLVLRTDGDAGVWRGRYDVWDRLYHEQLPTGAVILRRFDQANNPSQETSWDADPLTTPSAELLSEVRSHYTSFGEVARIAEYLSTDSGTGESEVRITEQEFDGSGRVVAVWSGPAVSDSECLENEPTLDCLDWDQARREVEIQYELESNRVMVEAYGGLYSGDGPLYAQSYTYHAENRSPWADEVAALESVPGEINLIETSRISYVRDALGRPLIETSSDGSVSQTSYDRAGGAIRMSSGAGTTTSVAFDSRGLPIRQIRPNDRGETKYAYDLDGRLLRQVVTAGNGEEWETAYHYDATGRVTQIDHEDGTSESSTYNDDNTVATRTGRDGVTVTFSYDTANRLLSAVPSAASLPGSLVALDAGDFFNYDELSRVTEVRRGSAGGSGVDTALTVAFPDYDLASRPGSEIVGSREPLGRQYDSWDRPIAVTLPAGVGRSTGSAFTGFERQYDSLDRVADVGGIGQLTSATLGATWSWGGVSRLYGRDSKAPLGTAVRYGYLGGRGAQPPGTEPGTPTSQWRLGTVTWGSTVESVGGVTEPPGTVWGQFAFGWRGNDGDPRDGVKQGRIAVPGLVGGGLDLFAGMGWSWNYDAGVRLSYAASGRGDVQGRAPPEGGDSYRYEYNEGDELERIVRESEGQIAELTVGAQGRITHRNGIPFAYDPVGRRTEDDRFIYRWTWRGELATVTVRDNWPEGEVSPFAGHQIRYEYDALGRMLYRWHVGALPEGETDDALRPFIEKRAFVWEDQGLVAEVAYGDPAETQIRWRKTYVPGAGGYDDAVQVAVEVLDLPGSSYPGSRLYTYLRDELGTVIGLIAEEEGNDPQHPSLPVRYFYSPYGEVHAETAPELRRVRFDNEVTEVGSVVQSIADPTVTAAGALRVGLSVPVVPESLSAGVVVERLQPGGGWMAVESTEVVMGLDEAEPADLLVLLRSGWLRGVSYRVGLTSALEDPAGRSFAGSESLEWSVPPSSDEQPEPPVIFEQRFGIAYESFAAAGDTVGGRFPGGQTSLFQGLWTDPVTGVAHARARWYDARNASWLSEDPYDDLDSPNLYAFVAWQPNMATDPSGELLETVWDVANIVMGLHSLKHNWEERNWGGMALDAFGILVDSAATLMPFIPGGAGSAIKGARALSKMDRIIDGLQTIDSLLNIGQGVYQAQEEASQGNYGWAAFYGGMSALGARSLAKTPAKFDSRGVGAKPHSPDVGRRADDLPGAAKLDSPKSSGLDSGKSAGYEAPCPLRCFAAGTVVLTADGPTPIEEIEPGDEVLAYDRAAGEARLAEVVRVFEREVDEVWLLTAGDAVIETTEEHPFFVVDRGWVEARDLQPGDLLQSMDGAMLRLDDVEREQRTIRVYNFEVRDLHSYFVGTEQVLAHNCGQTVLPKGIRFEGTIYRYEDPRRVATTWQAGSWNVSANHRYSAPGRGAIYGSTSPGTAYEEVRAWDVAEGRVLVEKDVVVENVLDLTDPFVRKHLGTRLRKIAGKEYSKTHSVGDWARAMGYKGILAPSARHASGANLVVFGGL